MSETLYERPAAVIRDASFRLNTSFGAAVYEGRIQHDTGRDNPFVETVPSNPQNPDSVVVIGGGFTSSEEHYRVVQRQLAIRGEHSVFAGHRKHSRYEIGHNAEDIAATCEAVAMGGIHKVVLLGHSRGGPEVLEAHELLRERKSDVQVTDIVLAFPAEFIERFPIELARNGPKFIIEMAFGFWRHPVRQASFTFNATRNICTDFERTVKEGLYLLTHHTGSDKVARLQGYDNRPRLHFVVGLLDGLIAGRAVLKTLEDKERDSLTVLRSGHIDLNTAPKVTDIILKEVRKVA